MRCMTLPAKWRCVRLASPTITAARPLAVRWTSCFTVTGVVEASVLVTSASDHNPLLVEFHPEKTPRLVKHR